METTEQKGGRRAEEKQRLSEPVSDTLLENQRLQQRVNQLETERPTPGVKS